MSEELTTVEPERTTFLIARNPSEMQEAQASLLTFMQGKLAEERRESRELNAIVKHARERKWKTSGLASRASKQVARVEFYEKAVRAVELGYALIPDFPIDVFAVRVKRDFCEAPDDRGNYRADVRDETTDSPPLGEGEFKSPRQDVRRYTETEKQKDGSTREVSYASAVALRDPSFPFRMARPLLMDAASRAMVERVFDEIGICPAVARKRDPMLIGKIKQRLTGYRDVRMSFLIAWYVDVRTL